MRLVLLPTQLVLEEALGSGAVPPVLHQNVGNCVEFDDALRDTGRGVGNSPGLLIWIENLWCGVDVRRRRCKGGRRKQAYGLQDDEAHLRMRHAASENHLHPHPPYHGKILLLTWWSNPDYGPRHTSAGEAGNDQKCAV